MITHVIEDITIKPVCREDRQDNIHGEDGELFTSFPFSACNH
jgi:hypothetical protein